MKIDRDFPLEISDAQLELVNDLVNASPRRKLVGIGVAVLNYDNRVLLDPEHSPIEEVLKPVYDQYDRLQGELPFFDLPPSVLRLRTRAVEAKGRGLNDGVIWEAFTQAARDTIKGLPESEQKEALWMSIYADCPFMDQELVGRLATYKLIIPRPLLGYLRRNLKEEFKQGRVGEYGRQELDSLNGFETSAVSSYVSFAKHEFNTSRQRLKAEQSEDAAEVYARLYNKLIFHSMPTLETTLRSTGNWPSPTSIPGDWGISVGGLLLTALATVDGLEESRKLRNQAATTDQEITSVELDNLRMKLFLQLGDTRNRFVAQWEWYAEAFLGFEPFRQRPLIYRLINRFAEVDYLAERLFNS